MLRMAVRPTTLLYSALWLVVFLRMAWPTCTARPTRTACPTILLHWPSRLMMLLQLAALGHKQKLSHNAAIACAREDTRQIDAVDAIAGPAGAKNDHVSLYLVIRANCGPPRPL